jgi:hypothetical protein
MRKFIVAAFALLGAATAASARPGGQCPEWGCGTNGTQRDGIQIEEARAGGVLAAVTLPSGEVLALDADAASTLRYARPRPRPRPSIIDCPRAGGCGLNGPQLDGIQIEDARIGGALAAVTLPSGVVLALSADQASAPRPPITKTTEPTSRN